MNTNDYINQCVDAWDPKTAKERVISNLACTVEFTSKYAENVCKVQSCFPLYLEKVKLYQTHQDYRPKTKQLNACLNRCNQ